MAGLVAVLVEEWAPGIAACSPARGEVMACATTVLDSGSFREEPLFCEKNIGIVDQENDCDKGSASQLYYAGNGRTDIGVVDSGCRLQNS